ncbi:MAG: dTDP-4-dehydrorhamnose reductase [Candidatus Jacksonbacteria bacterium]|nr:dTDP-4-dehydrorhamnose reductase [Candidatus Jacksonbacteria bacterium]
MKGLLLGKNGMLGQEICKNYELRSTNYEFISLGHEDLDITNKKIVHEKIRELRPKIVINATGYTNVDGAETEKETAFAVNAEGVEYLAEACAEINAALFHFSTDYIFDGTQAVGYKEDVEDHIKPLNVYGESKRAGELLITNYKLRIEHKEWKYFIIRTSWLYGTGGKNFVDTLLTRARDGQTEFKVVNDQFGKPTYTGDLAERVLWMIEQSGELESGIYHCVNEITNYETPAGIAWYDFAREIFTQARELGIIKKVPLVVPCATSEFPRPAKRPTYSALINTKLSPMREWKGALRDYLTRISVS